jgi:hypothetical protein
VKGGVRYPVPKLATKGPQLRIKGTNAPSLQVQRTLPGLLSRLAAAQAAAASGGVVPPPTPHTNKTWVHMDACAHTHREPPHGGNSDGEELPPRFSCPG